MNITPKMKENNISLSNSKVMQQSCSPKRRITEPDLDKPTKPSLVVVPRTSSPKIVVVQRPPSSNGNLNDVKNFLTQTSITEKPQASYKTQSVPLQNHMEPSGVLNLSHMMSLGEPDPSSINKHDILSAIAFDAKGKHLAVGDYGGRCIVFERN